jgi:hypothetical protein
VSRVDQVEVNCEGYGLKERILMVVCGSLDICFLTDVPLNVV